MQALIGSVAMFVLANTFTEFRSQKKFHYHYFEQRIKPIHDTWGSHFEHLYFVVGANKYDWEFLHDPNNGCTRVAVTDASARVPAKSSRARRERRRLTVQNRVVALSPQMPIADIFEVYDCQIAPEAAHKRYKKLLLANNGTDSTPSQYLLSSNPAPVRFLRVANCTGEYAGLGPTCRAQEAMRFYQANSGPGRGFLFGSTEWFSFIDDDVYFRPRALEAFLETFTRRQMQARGIGGVGSGTATEKGPIAAFVSGIVSVYRFTTKHFSTAELRSRNSPCMDRAFAFSFAQPMILSRTAMDVVMPSIMGGLNLITRLQLMWDGTHDAVVGLFLHLSGVPSYSMLNFYSDFELFKSEVFGFPEGQTQRVVRQFYTEPSPELSVSPPVPGKLRRNSYSGAFMQHKVRDQPLGSTYYRAADGDEDRSHHRFHETIVSQYDVQALFGDVPYHRAAAAWGSEATRQTANIDFYFRSQRAAGEAAATNLLQMMQPHAMFCTEFGVTNFRAMYPFNTGAGPNRALDLFTPDNCTYSDWALGKEDPQARGISLDVSRGGDREGNAGDAGCNPGPSQTERKEIRRLCRTFLAADQQF